MSKAPLPVPSTAAIRALRGLLFGTSCTLALVVEDRRRRINAARNALRNGERIKSAKRYHAGSSGLAAALQDDPLGPAVLNWEIRDGSSLKGSGRNEEDEPMRSPSRAKAQDRTSVEENQRATTTLPLPRPLLLDLTPSDSNPSPAALPPPFIEPLAGKLRLQRQRIAPGETRVRKPIHDAVTIQQPRPAQLENLLRLSELTENGDPESLRDALRLLKEMVQHRQYGDGLPDELLSATALLSRACQAASMMSEAQSILDLVVRSGPIDEADYCAHNPWCTIESLFQQEKGQASASARATIRQEIHKAATLFVPEFTRSPKLYPENFVRTGRKILQTALSAGFVDEVECLEDIQRVYQRVVAYPGDLSDLVPWFLGQLQLRDRNKFVVDFFLAHRPRIVLSERAANRVAKVVVEAVASSHGLHCDAALRKLIEDRVGETAFRDRRLRAAWASKLLYCHWQKHQDYRASLELFNELFGNDPWAKVRHWEVVCRTMIQILVEAGEHETAESLYADASRRYRGVADDVRTQGVLALSKAKRGEWASVFDIYEKTKTLGKTAAEYRSRALIPILKEHRRTHTIEESETFLKTCFDELEVAPCHEMVTLLANEYGNRRDVKSFVAWLEYCAQSGLEVDAAFANAILRNLEKGWKFCFEDLRTVYHELGSLGFSFEDEVTQNIMANSALSASRPGGRGARKRVESLRMPLGTQRRTRSISHQDDVYLVMKDASVCGEVQKTTSIYREAMENGMPYSEKCLNLAVQAHLQGSHRNPKEAVRLLKLAQAEGHNVDRVASHLVSDELQSIGAHDDPEAKAHAIRKMLARVEESQFALPSTVLNRVAMQLLWAKDYGTAVSLALRAADVECLSPGYNRVNFIVLLLAYSIRLSTATASSLSSMIINMLKTPLASDIHCLRSLKQARRILQRKPHGDKAIRQAQAAVEHGIANVERARQKLNRERTEVAEQAVDVMRQAALGSGRTLARFDGVDMSSLTFKRNVVRKVHDDNFAVLAEHVVDTRRVAVSAVASF